MFKNFLQENVLEEHEHQVDGVKWCLEKETIGSVVQGDKTKIIHGGIIADEMGLGKTIQLAGTMYANKLPHTLIVLPKALLDQWTHVIKKMLKQKPIVYHGIWKDQTSIYQLHSFPIIITTYGMIALKHKREQKENQKKTELSVLHEIKWDRIIFDEAHHMRNNTTNIYKGASKLKSNIKWFVTGTPIQNKCNDLYSLCSLLGLPTLYYTSPENIPNLSSTFILHRSKENVALSVTLPKLTVYTITIPWSNTYESDLSEDIHAMCQFSHVTKENIETPDCLLGEVTLVSLIRARQACILPQLLRKKYEKHIKEYGESENHDAIKIALDSSTKMDIVLETILAKKDNKKGKLIFCHFRGEIDYIYEKLMLNGLKTETFDGRTQEKQRNAILTNKNLDVLILQIQTGCEGLNLQQFSEVYFISPHWNPAIEDQAIARCHRFGQKEDVDVYKFNMTGFDIETNSLDEYSASVQENKRHLMKIIS